MTLYEEYKPIFYPDSIAVIGASKNPRKLGYHCLTSLVKGGYDGKIYPVNPNLSEVYGFKAYPSIGAIPGKVDLAIIVVPRHLVPSMIKECAAKGVRGIILITAGFKEAKDDVGAELQKEIATLATRFKIKIIGPNTFGVVNLHANLNASFTPEFSTLEKGGISLISQSGGFCHLVAPLSLKDGGGFSKIVGLGNRCNVDFADMLEYLLEDPQTRVIAMFIEGVDDARRLFEVASHVARKKPVVAYKAGRFRTSDEASYSHTGSLAGSYDLYMAAFKQSCVIAVKSSEEMLDAAKALALCLLPRGNRIAVVSAQAGLAMATCDVCERNGLEIVAFTKKTVRKIKKLLPPLSIRTNPVDMGPAWYSGETCKEVIKTVSGDKNVDALVVLAAYASANEPLVGEIAELLKALAREKPIVACFPSPEGIWLREKKELEQTGVPVYLTPERASKALANLVKYAMALKSKQKLAN
jgi:acyl-CoA synthetase (NDP forming)